MSFLYDLFIPHHDNDHRARILKPPILSFLTLIFICSQIFLNFFSLAGAKVLGYAANISPERVIELTNQRRAEAGLAPLKENPVLSDAARRKAADMFAFNYWAHNSPSGRDPWSFFREAGYKYIYAGENLARDFPDADSAVQAWMNSPSHKDNLLSSRYQEIGIAVVDGTLQGVETTLIVQHFGSQSRVVSKPTVQKTPPSQQVAPKPAVVEGEAEKYVSAPQITVDQTLSPETEGKFAPVINPFSLTKVMVIFLAGILLGTFLTDLLIVSERKTPRLSGRSFAQILFLGFIILMALISRQGAII